ARHQGRAALPPERGRACQVHPREAERAARAAADRAHRRRGGRRPLSGPVAWVLAAGVVGLGAVVLGLARAWRRERAARLATEADRDRAARELDRRLNELFSLRELGYALAASLQLDRLSREVVRYATRFLRA